MNANEKMDLSKSIYMRLQILCKEYNIRSINVLAKKFLKCNSSEKLQRMSRGGMPSLLIVIDIVKIFPNISLEWLILGKGTMYKEENIKSLRDERDEILSLTTKYISELNQILQKKKVVVD